MQLQLATLCDSAADYQGKLCILGAFDTMCGQQFPLVHPQCSLAIRLLFEFQDRGDHALSIRLVGENGEDLMPVQNSTMDASFPPGSASPFVTRILVLNLQQLCFERPGVYRFLVTLAGAPLTTIPVRVTRLEETRGAARAQAG